MKTVNALKIRNHLGEILDMLNETGEPIIVSRGRKQQAVLITLEQFQKRFLDFQAEEKKQELLDRILELKDRRTGKTESLEVLRELRGYPS
jgi:prevent-host-death family protein